MSGNISGSESPVGGGATELDRGDAGGDSSSGGGITSRFVGTGTTANGRGSGGGGARLRRLRRCKSFSRAEEIVTEEEKQRRSQPDKPIHKPRDSIFSLTSGFNNYEGVIHWAFLILSIGGVRLGLENINKYGIRVNPLAWMDMVSGYHQDGEFPVLTMLIYTNVPMLMALGLETLIFKNILKARVCMILHILNIAHVLLLPIGVIYKKYEQIGPEGKSPYCDDEETSVWRQSELVAIDCETSDGSLTITTFFRFTTTVVYAILALKLVSYVHVNYTWRKHYVSANRMRRRSNDDMSMTWPPLAKSSGSVDPVIKKKLKEIKRLKKGRTPAAIKVSPNKAFAKDLEPCKKEPLMDTTTSSEKIESNNSDGFLTEILRDITRKPMDALYSKAVARLNRTLWDYVEEILTKHRSKIEWIAPWIAPLAGYSTRLEKAMTSLGLLPEDDFLPSDDSIKVNNNEKGEDTEHSLDEDFGTIAEDAEEDLEEEDEEGGPTAANEVVSSDTSSDAFSPKKIRQVIALAAAATQESLFPSNFRTTAKQQRTTDPTVSGTVLVQYPDNLTVYDLYYFWLAPTLCYEINFPRSLRIRKTFLLRRALEVIVGINFLLALIQQWIIPSVVNSLIPFSNMDWMSSLERLLKLSVPNHLCWLVWFYLVFHSFLNTLAELMQFADRNFYNDWWNADNIVVFWKTWNLPVHRWCVRHLYKPCLSYFQGNKMLASAIVFFVSAFFHEYMVSVPLRIFKAYAFMGMMFQVPLMVISTQAEKHLGHPAGNIIVWMSLIIGQPLAVLMYYHDFVVEHYGKNLLESFGTL